MNALLNYLLCFIKVACFPSQILFFSGSTDFASLYMGALSFYSTPTSTIIISTFHSKITTNLTSYYDKKEHTIKFAQQPPFSRPQSPQVIIVILLLQSQYLQQYLPHPALCHHGSIWQTIRALGTLIFTSTAITLQAAIMAPGLNAG